jgi:hypothetical protein
MWRLDPEERMAMSDVCTNLSAFLTQLDHHIPLDQLALHTRRVTNKITRLYRVFQKSSTTQQVVPILKVDSAEISPSLLLQTMELQKEQSKEDDKWLLEEDPPVCPK